MMFLPSVTSLFGLVRVFSSPWEVQLTCARASSAPFWLAGDWWRNLKRKKRGRAASVSCRVHASWSSSRRADRNRPWVTTWPGFLGCRGGSTRASSGSETPKKVSPTNQKRSGMFEESAAAAAGLSPWCWRTAPGSRLQHATAVLHGGRKFGKTSSSTLNLSRVLDRTRNTSSLTESPICLFPSCEKHDCCLCLLFCIWRYILDMTSQRDKS